jgi:Arc/MetJ-type ribon-helix-helix transcriptional regulator
MAQQMQHRKGQAGKRNPTGVYLNDDLKDGLDVLVYAGLYINRSAAIEQIVRETVSSPDLQAVIKKNHAAWRKMRAEQRAEKKRRFAETYPVPTEDDSATAVAAEA